MDAGALQQPGQQRGGKGPGQDAGGPDPQPGHQVGREHAVVDRVHPAVPGEVVGRPGMRGGELGPGVLGGEVAAVGGEAERPHRLDDRREQHRCDDRTAQPVAGRMPGPGEGLRRGGRRRARWRPAASPAVQRPRPATAELPGEGVAQLRPGRTAGAALRGGADHQVQRPVPGGWSPQGRPRRTIIRWTGPRPRPERVNGTRPGCPRCGQPPRPAGPPSRQGPTGGLGTVTWTPSPAPPNAGVTAPAGPERASGRCLDCRGDQHPPLHPPNGRGDARWVAGPVR